MMQCMLFNPNLMLMLINRFVSFFSFKCFCIEKLKKKFDEAKSASSASARFNLILTLEWF